MMPRGIKVLLVEDDAASRANTRLLLELEGFATQVAADGVEGLALILAESPDVVVCDIMMPGLDGMGLLARVRETPACAATPFIFLTGLVDQRSLRAGMNGGADDYLTKPFAPEDLFAAILVRHRRLAVRPDDRRQQRTRVRELLSQRELEVFDLIGSGVSSRDAAERLGISLRTVDSHRARILAKLDLDGAAALVSLAARIGAGSLD